MSQSDHPFADVSGFHAVNEAGEDAPASANMLHAARAREYLTGQAVGIGIAIGGVALARHMAPEGMKTFAKSIESLAAGKWKHETPAFIHAESNRIADYAVMFSGGFVSALSTQIALARQRRSANNNGSDVSLGRDIQRVMSGWLIGMLGCTASVGLADRYLRAGSSYTISPILTRAETALDKRFLKGFEFASGRKLSEALVANGTMIVGGAPASVIGQRLYDALVGPSPAVKER